jgi:phosphoribosylformimino-5-aminoimidazole carboxamide ribotide isomerase
MVIFPAIDLKDGQCVRLMQGDPDRVTVYGNDPARMARRWQEEGAEWLHVVDLDGAFSKSPKNRRSIQSIVEAVTIPVQVGGGIRSLETINEYMELGLRRVILGTAALRQPDLLREAAERYPGRVALGIDARGGKVAVEGWKETTQQDAVSLVRQFDHLPLASIGVATISDIQALFPLIEVGLEGVITGRALYNGTLRLKDALACVQSHLKRAVAEP